MDSLATQRRSLWALYLVMAVKSIALVTYWWVVPVHVHRMTLGEELVLTNLLLFALPQVAGFFLAHAVGALIDMTGRIKVYILFALAVNVAAFAVILLVEEPMWILFAVGAGVSVNITLNTSVKTYGTRAMEEAHGKALGRIYTASSVGWFVGGGIVTFFFTDEPGAIPALALADILLIGIAGLFVAFLLPNLEMPSVERRTTLLRGVVEEFRALYSSRSLTLAVGAAMILGFGNWVYVSNHGVFLTEFLEAPERSIGLISIFSAITSAGVSLWAGRAYDRYGAAPLMTVGAIAYFVVYLVLALWPSVWTCLLVFATPAYAVVLIALTGTAARTGGVAHRGGGVGIVDGLWAGSIAVGALIGAFVGAEDLGRIPGVAVALIALGAVAVILAARRLPR